MRVVMNGLAAVKPKTGVGHYVANLYAALARRSDLDVTLYPAPDLARLAGRGYRLVGAGGGGDGKPSLAGRVAGTVKHLGKIAVGDWLTALIDAVHSGFQLVIFERDLHDDPKCLRTGS